MRTETCGLTSGYLRPQAHAETLHPRSGQTAVTADGMKPRTLLAYFSRNPAMERTLKTIDLNESVSIESDHRINRIIIGQYLLHHPQTFAILLRIQIVPTVHELVARRIEIEIAHVIENAHIVAVMMSVYDELYPTGILLIGVIDYLADLDGIS